MTEGKISGIVFDKDGTLFDFGATWESWAQAFLTRLGRDDTHRAALAAAVDFDLARGQFLPGSVVIAGTPAEITDALMPHLPGKTGADIFALLNQEAARAPQVEAVPLAPFLDGLAARGMMLGVATNDAEAPARAHLDAAGVLDRFDFVAGSDSGHGGKPAPGQLLAFCNATGLPPDQCIMVGDSLHDLRAGRAAGFMTVGVLTGYASEGQLAPYADVVLPDIGHVPDWLMRLTSGI